MENAHIIVADKANAAQLNTIHEEVKLRASGWWHRFQNVWIVGGDLKPSQWRDFLKDALAGEPVVNILVLRLPSQESERGWAFMGVAAKEATSWFREHYKTTNKSVPF